MAGLRIRGWRVSQHGHQIGQRPQAARSEHELWNRGERSRTSGFGMTGGQKLSPPVGALDHQMRLASMARAPHHRDQLTSQRMMRSSNPDPFEVCGSGLISLMAGV
ncbi:hypothetical protein ACFQX4_27860, partial [Roseomonas sp. GCM10028921]